MRRSSVSKASWTSEREEVYEAYCETILWERDMALRFEGDFVYLTSAEGEQLFLQITKQKTMWYEIWLALKYPDV